MAAEEYQQSVLSINQITKCNKWTKQQIREAIENLSQYVVVITDQLQRISFTGKGFYEMTGYTPEEAQGKNQKFL